MSTNFRFEGRIIDCTAPTGGVTAGVPTWVGSMFGVPAVSVDAGESYALHLGGVWELPKASANALTEGEVVYWNASAKNVTPHSTGDTKIGVAAKAAGANDTTAYVRLNDNF